MLTTLQDQEKSAETMILSQGPGSSTTSTLSGATQTGGKMSPPPVFGSPDMQNQHHSSRREAYSQTTRNTKHRPPLPDARRSTRHNNDSDIGYTYQVSKVKRSVSTREFRNLDQTKLLELHAVD